MQIVFGYSALYISACIICFWNIVMTFHESFFDVYYTIQLCSLSQWRIFFDWIKIRKRSRPNHQTFGIESKFTKKRQQESEQQKTNEYIKYIYLYVKWLSTGACKIRKIKTSVLEICETFDTYTGSTAFFLILYDPCSNQNI